MYLILMGTMYASLVLGVPLALRHGRVGTRPAAEQPRLSQGHSRIALYCPRAYDNTDILGCTSLHTERKHLEIALVMVEEIDEAVHCCIHVTELGGNSDMDGAGATGRSHSMSYQSHLERSARETTDLKVPETAAAATVGPKDAATSSWRSANLTNERTVVASSAAPSAGKYHVATCQSGCSAKRQTSFCKLSFQYLIKRSCASTCFANALRERTDIKERFGALALPIWTRRFQTRQ